MTENGTVMKMYQRSADIPNLRLDRGSNIVYVVKNPKTELVKIGLSSSPRSRIDTLELASGLRFDPICISSYFNNAKYVEYRLHAQFKDRRAIGEWFAIPFEDAVEALTEVCDFCSSRRRRFVTQSVGTQSDGQDR